MGLHVRVEVPAIESCLEALAEGLVLLNVALMTHASERGVDLPELYESGIVYRPEPQGEEWWESAADLLRVTHAQHGDCEDVAAYRTAELRFYDNEPARLRVIRTPRGSFHCVVERADGTIEDPSAILLRLESQRTGIPMSVLARKLH
jgi:hypothetical protein